MGDPGGRKNSQSQAGDGHVVPEHRYPVTWQNVDENKWVILNYDPVREEPSYTAKVFVNMF